MAGRTEWLRSVVDNLFALLEKSRGRDLSAVFQSSRDYRNPAIYEKIVDIYEIDQYGTHFDRLKSSNQEKNNKSYCSNKEPTTTDTHKHHHSSYSSHHQKHKKRNHSQYSSRDNRHRHSYHTSSVIKQSSNYRKHER